ncbi:MAG TPA: chemotaxis protein CheW [Planctomycetota bacterium]|jgi:chemotaxis signal transduction protein
MSNATGYHSTAAALRAAFDESFAAPPAAATPGLLQFLGFRIGSETLCVRLEEVEEVVLQSAVLPLPEQPPEMLGLAAVRGQIVPVFSLGGMLGYTPDPKSETCILLCKSAEPVGLAVTALQGQFQMPQSALHVAGERAPQRFVAAAVQHGDLQHWLVSFPAVLSALHERVR